MDTANQEQPRSSTTVYPPVGGYSQNYPAPAYDMSYGQSSAGIPPPGYYYPQPGYGYPGPQFSNYPSSMPQQQQQQQQQVVVVNSHQSNPMYVRIPPVSMVGAIVMSCIAFWFCGWLLGGIAFILAMVGQSSAAAGDNRGAIQLRNASFGLSIAGIVCGVIIIAVIAGVLGSAAAATHQCYSYYYGYYYTC